MNRKWLYTVAVVVAFGSLPALSPAHAKTEPPECSDSVDNDGDGYTDFPDDPECDETNDDMEYAHVDSFRTAVTIRYARKTAFKGTVASDHQQCSDQRRVELRRRYGNGSRIVARTFTSAQGRWKVYWPRAEGRYFALARSAQVIDPSGATIFCRRDASVTIRVRS